MDAADTRNRPPGLPRSTTWLAGWATSWSGSRRGGARRCAPVRGGRAAFFEQQQVQDAVLRRLEILADVTAQLSPKLEDRHPGIPWREVYGLGNIAAHAYLDIDLERVWEIVTDHLPPLRTAAEKELETLHE
jgi:uncharacterized protein with HEPN domain